MNVRNPRVESAAHPGVRALKVYKISADGGNRIEAFIRTHVFEKDAMSHWLENW